DTAGRRARPVISPGAISSGGSPVGRAAARPVRLSAAELGAALVGRLVTQLLFDAQQLVVLGYPVGAAQRTGLDLTGSSTHGQVGNGVVLGLAAAVGDDGRSEEHTSELQSRENL